MSLSIGIVGLPNVGKSSLFKVLTKKQVDIQNYPFCTIDPNVGVVAVPDERVKMLADFSRSRKIIPAAMEFVDIAGLVKGASEGEGLGNKFLSHIREVDAIAHVVRVFKNDDIVHIHNAIDPQNDVLVIETELILADLETVTKHLGSMVKEIRSGGKDVEIKNMIFIKLKEVLEKGESASEAFLTPEEKFLTRELHLLTMKPVIYIYNTSGNNVEISGSLKSKNNVFLDIKTEEDLMELAPAEAKVMRGELNMNDGLDNLIRECYRLLGLITYFTTGEDETRAWTIKENTSAPEAGMAIHTDFKEKFIRAEVINWQKLLDAGSYGRARELGLLRTEGKEYTVEDGDVIEFKI